MRRNYNVKTLFFTDSRGKIKDTFTNLKIFWQNYAETHDCDFMLCPYKWTTSLDFIKLIEEKKINIDKYDKIVLYTGVVEFSPRPMSNFKQCSANKLEFMREFLGEYVDLDTTYNFDYMGEDTKSLITLAAYEKVVVPYLQTLGDKLVLINTNRTVSGWEGNYLRINSSGRPKNINVVADYSQKTVGTITNLVNLLEWDDDDVKKFTVDNMHLTHLGSEFISQRLAPFLV